MRYFYVSYSHSSKDRSMSGFGSMGRIEPTGFPSMSRLIDAINDSLIKDSVIVILNIREMTESDFEDFFRTSQSEQKQHTPEQEAKLFSDEKLRPVSGLLSKDYKEGYMEGVLHYIESLRE